MTAALKTAILKNCPYPVIDFARNVRGKVRKIKGNLAAHGLFKTPENVCEAIKRGYLSYPEYLQKKEQGTYPDIPRSSLRWARAFDFYRNRLPSSHSMRLLWTDGPSPGNFGDWLSPYILRALTDCSIELVDDYAKPSFNHMVAVGSLAPAISERSFVLGAGAARKDTRINTSAHFYSVRGPYTASLIQNQGGPEVNEFGDLGFILSRVYKPKKISIDAEVVFVRHMNHGNYPINIPEGVIELSIEAASPEEVERFIDVIHSVGKVVTTAMHCFIVCQSYKIPCALVTFSELKGAVYGDGLKYLDAMAGVDLPERRPAEVSVKGAFKPVDAMFYEHQISEDVIDRIEIHAKKSLEHFIALNPHA